ncbi:hypothetical protein O6H91_Y079700 [Diphasiastrum complanatum]|nr:hypothetical protein O6H91_Y079700 [Diphasiastrum complanatum]
MLIMETQHTLEGVTLVGRSMSELRNRRCPSWFHQPPRFQRSTSRSLSPVENQLSTRDSFKENYHTLKQELNNRQTIMSLFKADSRPSSWWEPMIQHPRRLTRKSSTWQHKWPKNPEDGDAEESILRKLLFKFKSQAQRIGQACSGATIFIHKDTVTYTAQSRSSCMSRTSCPNSFRKQAPDDLGKCRSLRYITIYPQQQLNPPLPAPALPT